MNVTLCERTAKTVAIYFEKAQHPIIRKTLPQKAQSVEEALADYSKTQQPGATSYGSTIYVDGRYVGDVWVYSIDMNDTPNAMLSYCIFETDMWDKGIATVGVQLFLKEVQMKFGLRTLGAFTYTENTASIRVLEKNGFSLEEEFTEKGIVSRYYQRRLL